MIEVFDLDITSLRFLLDAERIQIDNTVREIGLQNDDTIQVFSEQTGGGGKKISYAHIQLVEDKMERTFKRDFKPGYRVFQHSISP